MGDLCMGTRNGQEEDLVEERWQGSKRRLQMNHLIYFPKWILHKSFIFLSSQALLVQLLKFCLIFNLLSFRDFHNNPLNKRLRHQRQKLCLQTPTILTKFRFFFLNSTVETPFWDPHNFLQPVWVTNYYYILFFKKLFGFIQTWSCPAEADKTGLSN